jgi:hypothetical protein
VTLIVKENNSGETIDTGKEIYRSKEEKNKVTMQIWIPYYYVILEKWKPEQKFPLKINTQRR